MIDTENKRRSVIGSGLDFLTIRPAPDSTMDVFDRRHRAAFYSGIETLFSSFFFWRQDARQAGDFSKVKAAGEAFARERAASKDWVEIEEIRDTPL